MSFSNAVSLQKIEHNRSLYRRTASLSEESRVPRFYVRLTSFIQQFQESTSSSTRSLTAVLLFQISHFLRQLLTFAFPYRGTSATSHGKKIRKKPFKKVKQTTISISQERKNIRGSRRWYELRRRFSEGFCCCGSEKRILIVHRRCYLLQSGLLVVVIVGGHCVLGYSNSK